MIGRVTSCPVLASLNKIVQKRGRDASSCEALKSTGALLLECRPDIVEAEQNLQAASARIGVAKATFFPTIKLTSTASLASADLGTVFDWPSRVGSVGLSIHVPAFEGGRNRAQLDASKARYDQAIAEYRGAILNAFREVEDSLSDLNTLTSQGRAVDRALVSSRDTVALANERY